MRTLILLLIAATPALAGDVPSAKQGWQFEATPYLWGAASSGTVGIQGLPEVKVEASFADIFSKLNVGVLGRLEGRKDRLGFSTDLVYLNLGIPLAENQPVIAFLGPEVDLRQFMGEGIGFYRVARDARNPGGAWLDVFAGARYTHVRTEMELVSGSIAESTVDLVDAIGGLRGRAPLGAKAGLLVRGDVGGGTSKIAWNVEASLTFAISRNWTLGAGYRYLHEDYSNRTGSESRSIDVSFKGPLLQATVAF